MKLLLYLPFISQKKKRRRRRKGIFLVWNGDCENMTICI